MNKTHTMILVCAADDFHKYWKKRKMSVCFLKIHKKNVSKAKIQVFDVFSSPHNIISLINESYNF